MVVHHLRCVFTDVGVRDSLWEGHPVHVSDGVTGPHLVKPKCWEKLHQKVSFPSIDPTSTYTPDPSPVSITKDVPCSSHRGEGLSSDEDVNPQTTIIQLTQYGSGVPGPTTGRSRTKRRGEVYIKDDLILVEKCPWGVLYVYTLWTRSEEKTGNKYDKKVGPFKKGKT